MSVDVAIVGAGLAGLSAARDLTAAKKTVVVLEARDRVGGRVENQLLDNGGVIELGAAFVGPTQDRVLALAEELGPNRRRHRPTSSWHRCEARFREGDAQFSGPHHHRKFLGL